MAWFIELRNRFNEPRLPKVSTIYVLNRVGDLAPWHCATRRSQRHLKELTIFALLASSIHQLKEMNTDDLILSSNLENNKITVHLSILIDIEATDYAFIDKSFTQQHDLSCFPLSESHSLHGFDGNTVVSESITHYVKAKLWVSEKELEETLFYVTLLSQYPVVLGLSWLKSHKAVIDLDRNQLIFELSANQNLVIESASVPSSSIPTVSVSAESTISAVLLSAESLCLSSKSLEVYVIGSVLFCRLARKKNHEIFAIFMRNIDKALQIKSTVDSATLLPLEYHDFLDVFFRELADTLSERRFYDHKIPLQKDKTLTFDSLYGMSQNELRVLKKYLKNNLAKDFIQASSSSAASSMLFVRKSGGGLRFCVNYRELNAITIKNCYSLPLIREILDRLVKTRYYIKLDIIAIFNKLQKTYNEE